MGGIKSNIVASLFTVLLLCVAVGCSASDNMDEGKDFVELEDIEIESGEQNSPLSI